ncbi:uncharacterized protein BDV14DRAFT_197975 [Aspergillus stella-maris]|uniref:uncharacterized protein n=1 Tax=Aspergillus stella-maris TaxID=1810926 RepID=UPI003CCD163E
MKLSTTILATVLAAATGTVAQDYPYTEYTCENSDGSPYLHHVNALIDGLKAATGENICNADTNGCGETIRAYSNGGGAGFMVCGAMNRCSLDPQGLPCSNGACGGILAPIVGTAIEGIRDTCQGPDSNGDTRVGGIQITHYSAEFASEIRLFTLPG